MENLLDKMIGEDYADAINCAEVRSLLLIVSIGSIVFFVSVASIVFFFLF